MLNHVSCFRYKDNLMLHEPVDKLEIVYFLRGTFFFSVLYYVYPLAGRSEIVPGYC